VVDVCLIPEVPFSLEKLLSYLGEVLDKKGNAVVCVAEGAGQVRGVRGGSGGVAPVHLITV
jgi:6-phosphofructokinase 1